jgi:hypothetical protein
MLVRPGIARTEARASGRVAQQHRVPVAGSVGRGRSPTRDDDPVTPMRTVLRNEPAGRARGRVLAVVSLALGFAGALTGSALGWPLLVLAAVPLLVAALDRRRAIVLSSDGLEIVGYLRRRLLPWTAVRRVTLRRAPRDHRGTVLVIARSGRCVRAGALSGGLAGGKVEAAELAAIADRYRATMSSAAAPVWRTYNAGRAPTGEPPLRSPRSTSLSARTLRRDHTPGGRWR